jgi:hypothetical protein
MREFQNFMDHLQYIIEGESGYCQQAIGEIGPLHTDIALRLANFCNLAGLPDSDLQQEFNQENLHIYAVAAAQQQRVFQYAKTTAYPELLRVFRDAKSRWQEIASDDLQCHEFMQSIKHLMRPIHELTPYFNAHSGMFIPPYETATEANSTNTNEWLICLERDVIEDATRASGGDDYPAVKKKNSFLRLLYLTRDGFPFWLVEFAARFVDNKLRTLHLERATGQTYNQWNLSFEFILQELRTKIADLFEEILQLGRSRTATYLAEHNILVQVNS